MPVKRSDPVVTLPVGNALLQVLPRRVRTRLLEDLELVELVFGDMLHAPGEVIRHAYFPGTAMISLLAVAAGHPALEVGLIGREGMVGIGLGLGGSEATFGALVQGGGSAYKITARHLRLELATNPVLERQVLRFAEVLMAQISQTAACNRFHLLDARLARWLLMSSDRLQRLEFRMTHEFLGHMLGVRRVGVTQAAHALGATRVISYRRGVITIIDRPGLEHAACACYAFVRAIYARAGIVETQSG